MTLILAGWLVANADETPKRDWALRVVGEEVADIGPIQDLVDRYPDDDTFDATERILAPGFVDSHMHLYGTLAHGIPAGNAPSGFWSFLDDFWWPHVENALDHSMITTATEWVAGKLLAGGVTTFYDIVEAPFAIPGALLAQRDVLSDVGIRAILSFEATERIDRANGQLGLQENADLIVACQRDPGLISGMMSYHTTFTCSADMIQQAFGMAEDLGVMCHAHVNEGTHEPDWCLKHKGKRTFEYYRELGVTTEHMLASQCVQLSEVERRIIQESGVRCTHMPLSNCEVGGGIAPVPEQLEAGVTMGLGSDGYVIDMFEVMRGAFLIHKGRLQDPRVMPAHKVFAMATAGGATALGLERVGRLEPGWAADLQLISSDLPTPLTAENLFDQVVLWRTAHDVTDVMVAGTWRVRDGEVLDLDMERAGSRLREEAGRLWAKI